MFEHSYHATHTTSVNQKPREDDSFELADIDGDTDGQFYVWLWCLHIMFERSYHARSYHSIVYHVYMWIGDYLSDLATMAFLVTCYHVGLI